MKLDAVFAPSHKFGQAPVGKVQNNETKNQQFSDALKIEGDAEANSGDEVSLKLQELPEMSIKSESKVQIDAKIRTGSETASKISAKGQSVETEHAQELTTDEIILEANTVETPELKLNEKTSPQNSTLFTHPALVEKLTASKIGEAKGLADKIGADVSVQRSSISQTPLNDRLTALDQDYKLASKVNIPENSANTNRMLESLLNQKEIKNKSAGAKIDFETLPTNDNAKDAMKLAAQKSSPNNVAMPNLSATQDSLSKNQENSAGKTTQIPQNSVKGNVPNKNEWTMQVEELKATDVKPGGLKIGEVRSGEVKVGEVKLERIAPTNINQVIINTLSSTGRPSTISTNVIAPGQIPTKLEKNLTIQLHPKDLGVVEIKISNRNGRLNISVETSTHAAEKILKTEMFALAEKLAVSGILHDEMTVRNNPGLEIMKESTNLDRNSNLNSNQPGEGQFEKNRESEFKEQLHGQQKANGDNTSETEQAANASQRSVNTRDSIYL